MKQIYSNYTAEDRKVWQILFERQMKNLRGIASAAYLEAIDVIEFTKDRIPKFSEVNKILGDITGWSLHVVPCISPQKKFFQLNFFQYQCYYQRPLKIAICLN